jgi:alpha-galactosidase
MGCRRVLAGAICGIALLAGAAPARAIDDGQALTPPMGYNDWNAFGCNVSESLIKDTALAIHANGLQDAGYQYVNIDDCWMTHARDAGGHLVPDPVKFPSGIKGTADYVHSLGLKLGIYEDAGSATCAGFPGSYGHEGIDAQDFADWGVDYLKYDNCNTLPGTADTQQQFIDRYSRMRDALKATGRQIVYSLCEWGQQSPWLWGAGVGHLWRTTGDISDNYGSMLGIVKQNAPLDAYGGPGHWNDPDMLEIGNGGMTDTEYRSHFSLWAIMAAPLLIGSDLRNASAPTLTILSNREVIAVDQDPLGKQGRMISNAGGHWVFAKPLQNGDVAVALFNETAQAASISTSAAAAGLPQRDGYGLHDLWKHAARLPARDELLGVRRRPEPAVRRPGTRVQGDRAAVQLRRHHGSGRDAAAHRPLELRRGSLRGRGRDAQRRRPPVLLRRLLRRPEDRLHRQRRGQLGAAERHRGARGRDL